MREDPREYKHLVPWSQGHLRDKVPPELKQQKHSLDLSCPIREQATQHSPFRMLTSVSGDWSRGDKVQAWAMSLSFLCLFSPSPPTLLWDIISSLSCDGIWRMESLTGNQIVIGQSDSGTGPSSWLGWKSLWQSKGNCVGLFVIDRKFLLQEWQALPPAQKGVLAPGPLPSELSKSLSFFPSP